MIQKNTIGLCFGGGLQIYTSGSNMNTNLKRDHIFTVLNLWFDEELLLEMVWFVLCSSEELL